MGGMTNLPALVGVKDGPDAADADELQFLLHRQQHASHWLEKPRIDDLPVFHERVAEHEMFLGGNDAVREVPGDHVGHEEALYVREVAAGRKSW